MFCEKCGAKIDDDAMFCHKCGHSFTGKTDVVKERALTNTVSKNKVKLSLMQMLIRAVSVVVILLSIVSIGFTGTVRYTVKGPEDTLENFFLACNNLDVDGVLDTLDPETAKEYSFAISLIGGLSGWGIDAASLSQLGGMFSGFLDPDMRIVEMETEYVVDGKRSKDLFGIKKATAEDAEITCTYIMNGTEQTEVFALHKYNGNWKLEGE